MGIPVGLLRLWIAAYAACMGRFQSPGFLIRLLSVFCIWAVNITYGNDDEIDFGFLEERLCPGCMGKILAACGEGGEDACRNVFLVDLWMMEFYSLPENIISFMGNDYYFHVDHGEGEDRVLIVYAPVFRNCRKITDIISF